MGMAASQARYLALVARKSNCEYEGQQINQARTVLSNQSANLFNQMLGLSVPIPPSTQDYTVTQYSYKDGLNESTISSWQQLANNPDYNYVVTHYYYTDKYTGSQKKLSDPQVQFTSGAVSTSTQIQQALQEITRTKTEYEAAKAAREAKEKEAATLSNYADKISNVTSRNKDNDGNYTINWIDSSNQTKTQTFKGYDHLGATGKSEVDTMISKLVGNKALPDSYLTNKSGVFYDETTKQMSFASDLSISSTILTVYDQSGNKSVETIASNYTTELGNASTPTSLRGKEQSAKAAYDQAVQDYDVMSHPSYIGNCELTPIEELTSDQKAEVDQIIADMEEQGINADVINCFRDGNYIGGLYTFKLNGITYYATYNDLEASYESGTGNNQIDGQIKLPYYNASYVSTKIEQTEKALVETDGSGRFTSIRFEDDSVVYTLNMETVTDEAAYQDAMNQYYYDNAVYDKTIRDINAKTSIIQQEDQQLELRLKQLDTEQSALSTEMEAVKKVVDDNVESSFKTFGG